MTAPRFLQEEAFYGRCESMNSLLSNAVLSIQLGVEDFESEDPRRAVSAIRNFYAGVLLLAKEVLLRTVPKASSMEVLATRYKPIPDGKGGVNYEAVGHRTIDLQEIEQRFREFNIDFDVSALRSATSMRNDIEHFYTEHPAETVRYAIATAFPAVADLFKLLDEAPASVLGKTWSAMLEVRSLYERELLACQQTFALIDWQSPTLQTAKKICYVCESELIGQRIPENIDFQSIITDCRNCGTGTLAEQFIKGCLDAHLSDESYLAVKDGGTSPLHDCPECGVHAYLTTAEETGCVWCGLELGTCAVCDCGLSPENVCWDNHGLCSYHGSKIDD